MMKKKTLFCALLLAAAGGTQAQVTINLDAAKQGVKVSPTLYGIFFEEINHGGEGGLYAELLQNRSFEDQTPARRGQESAAPKSSVPAWSAVGGAEISLTQQNLLNSAQQNALHVKTTAKGKLAGIENSGFWGVPAVQGRKYQLSFWVRARKAYKGTLTARLTDKSGAVVYAEAQITPAAVGKKWTKLTASLTSVANDAEAVFQLLANQPAELDFDVVSLFPPTYKNRENGCRPELASMLADLHPRFMRFPGGCYVEGQQSPDNAFRWDRTIGPIEERSGHRNVNWGYRVTDGLGYHEMLQLSEDLGAEPLFVVNVGIWHGGFTPVDSIQPWIDECLNAIEYANGPVTSKYGALRAKNGHPAPFNLKYLEIGNENNQPNASQQSDRYYDRYKLFQDAILAKYPYMHCIGNVAAWGTDYPEWESDIPSELLDEHYYRSPQWFAGKFHHYDNYERGKHQIYVGEYAVTQNFGVNGHLTAGLGEAVFMMGMENNSDVVAMASYAPIFVNEHHQGWRPDMIRFTASQACGTPSYYVQKLMAENVGTRMLQVEQTNPYEGLKLTTLKPAKPVQVGMGSWLTKNSFRDLKVKQAEGAEQAVGGDLRGVRGDWTTQSDGTVAQQNSRKDNCVAVQGEAFKAQKYSYTLKARKDEGKEGMLIVFNYQDDDNYCWLNLGGWDNTQHAIEQTIDGSRQPLVEKKGSVESGRWYDVRIDVDGDSIACYLDGAFLLGTRLPGPAQGLYTNAAIDDVTGETIVKIVNMGAEGTTAQIKMEGLSHEAARVIRLTSASGKDENSLADPTKVYPTEERLSPTTDGVELHVPAYSLNIVRIK